jgi:hypothetical protein
MNIAFPSHAFDEAVAAVCHGAASEEQVRALNTLLRTDGNARDGTSGGSKFTHVSPRRRTCLPARRPGPIKLVAPASIR